MALTQADRDMIELVADRTAARLVAALHVRLDAIAAAIAKQRSEAIAQHVAGCPHGQRLRLVLALAAGLVLASGGVGVALAKILF